MSTPVPATVGNGSFVVEGPVNTAFRLAEDGTWVSNSILATANTWTASQTFADVNLVLGTTTGTKIGTATGQKLGFWNATPVVQQVLATGAGKTADNIISLLQTLGLCKQA